MSLSPTTTQTLTLFFSSNVSSANCSLIPLVWIFSSTSSFDSWRFRRMIDGCVGAHVLPAARGLYLQFGLFALDQPAGQVRVGAGQVAQSALQVAHFGAKAFILFTQLQLVRRTEQLLYVTPRGPVTLRVGPVAALGLWPSFFSKRLTSVTNGTETHVSFRTKDSQRLLTCSSVGA